MTKTGQVALKFTGGKVATAHVTVADFTAVPKVLVSTPSPLYTAGAYNVTATGFDIEAYCITAEPTTTLLVTWLAVS